MALVATVEGVVLKTERKQGTSGERSWDYRELRVLNEQAAEIATVRVYLDTFEGDLPREGEIVKLECSINAWSGRSGAGLSVTAQRNLAEPAAHAA